MELANRMVAGQKLAMTAAVLNCGFLRVNKENGSFHSGL